MWVSKTQDRIRRSGNEAPFLVHLAGPEGQPRSDLYCFHFKCSKSNGAVSGRSTAIMVTREQSQCGGKKPSPESSETH